MCFYGRSIEYAVLCQSAQHRVGCGLPRGQGRGNVLADGDFGGGGSDADDVDAGGRYIDGGDAVGIGGFGGYQCAIYCVYVRGGRGLRIGD